MQLPGMPFIVLDTETTGLFPRVHRVIELALVRIENGKMTETYEQLFRADDDIPPCVQVLTRIRPEDLQGKPVFEECRDDLRARIGSETLLVGQNVGFDLEMLHGEGLDLRENPWIDTSMLASLVFPELASYSLGYMSTVLGLRHDPVHRALGDVRATIELFERIWERMEKLPGKHRKILYEIFSRSTSGYALLADALPKKSAATSVPWTIPTREKIMQDVGTRTLPGASKGTVILLEDSLDPHSLHQIIVTAREAGVPHWIAVKNLEATLRRIELPSDVRVLHPPFLLLDTDAAEKLYAQENFSADEATLAVKLHWYAPRVQEDFPLHGGERDVWNGKVACTESAKTYTAQFQKMPQVILIDHRQLLEILADAKHPARGVLQPNHVVIIDDASMLEDTATKAYGHHLTIGDLRAASIGQAQLTKFTDLVELWVEKVRGQNDIHLVQKSDRIRRETKGLQEQLETLLSERTLPARTRQHLKSLACILTEKDDNAVVWIEARQQKSTLRLAPERVNELLKENLFSRFSSILLTPPGFESLPEVTGNSSLLRATSDSPSSITIACPDNESGVTILENHPQGKTIILLPSKRIIEEYFVRFTERLEKKGVTLICQGFGGGQGRMEAEFTAARSPALLLLTPWTYEGFELPQGSVNRLVIEALPFDHPSDLLMQVRSKHYQNAFAQYTMPRLKARLFRLLRTFCRHRTLDGDVQMLDARIRTKEYGKEIWMYLEQFSAKKPPTPGGQMKMF